MAWNDPQWGNRDNRKPSGPPDLDEVVRKFNQKLNGLFGGKSGGGGTGGEGGEPVAQLPGGKSLFGVLALVAVLVWLASGFYIVDTGQRGVVLRFGKYVQTTEPGLRWHLPWPVESSEIVNLDLVRTVEVGYRNNVRSKVLKESLMLTDDENIIDLQFAVQYILRDPEDYLFVNRAPDETVLQVAETAMREIVGRSSMDFVLYEGRAEIATSARQLMQQILDRYRTGITVSQVTLQNIQPPEQVQAAFDDAVKAGQDRERLKNEAEAYANDVVPRARGLASRLKEEAEGYRLAVIANAEGEASRFAQILAEYQRAPQVTRQRLYLDTMQTVMNNTSKVIVDQKSGNSLLYLPLDKLQQLAGQGGAANSTGAGAAADMLNSPLSALTPSSSGAGSDSRNMPMGGRDRESRP